MNKLYTLIKRECWEHKFRFFFLPVYTSIIFVVLFYLYVACNWHYLNKLKISTVKSATDIATAAHDPFSFAILYELAFLPLALVGLYLLINYIFYPLQALFQDRKDGSIAFFRSMPYSEGKEIASKLITILLIAPIFYWAVGTVFWHLTMPTLNHFIHKNMDAEKFLIASSFLNKSLVKMFLAQTCFLPYIAYLFFCSAYAKRSPFFLAVTPLFIIIAIERIIFGTHHIFYWLTTPIRTYKHSEVKFGNFDAWKAVFHTPSFWYGILIAVALFAGAMILRKRNAANI